MTFLDNLKIRLGGFIEFLFLFSFPYLSHHTVKHYFIVFLDISQLVPRNFVIKVALRHVIESHILLLLKFIVFILMSTLV